MREGKKMYPSVGNGISHDFPYVLKANHEKVNKIDLSDFELQEKYDLKLR